MDQLEAYKKKLPDLTKLMGKSLNQENKQVEVEYGYFAYTK